MADLRSADARWARGSVAGLLSSCAGVGSSEALVHGVSTVEAFSMRHLGALPAGGVGFAAPPTHTRTALRTEWYSMKCAFDVEGFGDYIAVKRFQSHRLDGPVTRCLILVA